jgi:hypothetical protein
MPHELSTVDGCSTHNGQPRHDDERSSDVRRGDRLSTGPLFCRLLSLMTDDAMVTLALAYSEMWGSFNNSIHKRRCLAACVLCAPCALGQRQQQQATAIAQATNQQPPQPPGCAESATSEPGSRQGGHMPV